MAAALGVARADSPGPRLASPRRGPTFPAAGPTRPPDTSAPYHSRASPRYHFSPSRPDRPSDVDGGATRRPSWPRASTARCRPTFLPNPPSRPLPAAPGAEKPRPPTSSPRRDSGALLLHLLLLLLRLLLLPGRTLPRPLLRRGRELGVRGPPPSPSLSTDLSPLRAAGRGLRSPTRPAPLPRRDPPTFDPRGPQMESPRFRNRRTARWLTDSSRTAPRNQYQCALLRSAVATAAPFPPGPAVAATPDPANEAGVSVTYPRNYTDRPMAVIFVDQRDTSKAVCQLGNRRRTRRPRKTFAKYGHTRAHAHTRTRYSHARITGSSSLLFLVSFFLFCISFFALKTPVVCSSFFHLFYADTFA
jgi:hypothetical protein